MELLKVMWEKWKKLSHVLGNFQGQLLFTVFYFLILFPVGLGVRLLSDPLNIKIKRKKSNFNPWEHPEEDLEEAKKPY